MRFAPNFDKEAAIWLPCQRTFSMCRLSPISMRDHGRRGEVSPDQMPDQPPESTTTSISSETTSNLNIYVVNITGQHDSTRCQDLLSQQHGTADSIER